MANEIEDIIDLNDDSPTIDKSKVIKKDEKPETLIENMDYDEIIEYYDSETMSWQD